jgi:HAD superfamily hydrolase (TIGR01509 family)
MASLCTIAMASATLAPNASQHRSGTQARLHLPISVTSTGYLRVVIALQLVIFDCDGVLVDSESLSNGVLAQMLTEEGLPMTLAQARRAFQGLLLAQVAAKVQASLGRPLPDGWMGRFEQRRAELFRRELTAVPGAHEVVECVRGAGLQVCVASQGKLEKTRLSLELTGLRALFGEQALFSAEQVPRGKPHPDLFLHAARSMGVAAGECIVVEDTPSGVLAGRSAGMRTFGYAADSDERMLREAGASIVHALGELPALLGL